LPDVSGPTGSERRDEPSLFLPCLIAAAQTLILINHAPLLPLIMRDLAITPAQAGLLSTVTFLGGGLLAIPAGRLTDWLGARWTTAGSIVILLLSTLGMAAAPDYAALLAVRLFSGVGVSASFIAAGHYANAHWSGPRNALAQGLLGGCMQLGIGTAIFTLPFVAGLVGWRRALALCAVPLAVALGLWLRWARATPRRSGSVSMRSVFTDPASWRLGLVNGATFGLTVVLGTWVAVYFVEEFGLALTLAGMFGAQTALLGMVGRPIGGLLIARGVVGARALIRWMLAGSALALLLLAWPGRPAAVAAGAVILVGITASLSYPGMLVLVSRVRPNATGAVLGVVSTVGSLVVILGAPAIGALFSASGGFSLPFALLALLPAAAVWATAGLPRDRA
jgi:NNP family nitrate/nitrite transporter-like MFS transporter